MSLLDIMTGPWAIVPEKLLEIQAIYAAHMRGDKIDVAGIEARLGRPLANEQRAYSVESGGVGLLPAIGIMSPRANLLMQVSGGISTSMLTRQIETMRSDPRVRAALIQIDSPGGNALAVPAAVAALRALAAEKPTVVVGEGTVASAAYWLGSAANALFIEGETDMVGSIGVYMRAEWSKPSDTSREFAAGRYKRLSLNGEPPSADAIADVQQRLDYLYGVFVDAVAQHRGVSADMVLEHMADGRVFIGQQAVDAGLVDGFSTVDAMLDRLAAKPGEFAQRRKTRIAGLSPRRGAAAAQISAPLSQPPGAGDAPGPADATGTVQAEGDDSRNPPKGTVMPQADTPTLTRASLERDHPALFAELRTEFTAEGAKTGAQAERDRIAAVRAQALPGHEALVEQLAMDGKTTGPEAAVAVLKAQREAGAAAAKAHADDAPPPVKGSHAPASDKPGKSKEQQAAEAKAYAAEHKVDFLAAYKALGFAA